jgi:hypothetical protein
MPEKLVPDTIHRPTGSYTHAVSVSAKRLVFVAGPDPDGQERYSLNLFAELLDPASFHPVDWSDNRKTVLLGSRKLLTIPHLLLGLGRFSFFLLSRSNGLQWPVVLLPSRHLAKNQGHTRTKECAENSTRKRFYT